MITSIAIISICLNRFQLAMCQYSYRWCHFINLVSRCTQFEHKPRETGNDWVLINISFSLRVSIEKSFCQLATVIVWNGDRKCIMVVIFCNNAVREIIQIKLNDFPHFNLYDLNNRYSLFIVEAKALHSPSILENDIYVHIKSQFVAFAPRRR